MAAAPGALTISSVFEQEGMIPKKYTCEGNNVNPPIEISGIPEETKSLVLIVEDPDAPGGLFIHWLCWNITPRQPIEENSSPGIDGVNGFGKSGYMGPCPPKGSHRYFFKAYALDDKLELSSGTTKDELLLAMKEHILATGELMGRYQKTGQ